MWGAIIGAAASYLGSKKSKGSGSAYSGSMNKAVNFLDKNLPTDNNNPYLNLADINTRQRLDGDYKAYSDEDIARMYNQRADYLQDNVIDPQDDAMAVRLGRSGLAGSKTAAGDWEDRSAQNKQLLSDVYNSLQDQNLAYTQQAQQSAYSALPTLSSLYMSNETNYLNPWLNYAGILSGNNNSANAQNRQDQSATGAAIGNILSSYFGSR